MKFSGSAHASLQNILGVMQRSTLLQVCRSFGTFDSGLLVLVLSWTDASLVTNVLQMMQRRYDANAKPGTYWRNPRSPVRIKKRRNLYEDNKYKERPEYKKKKSPAPPRQKRIDLGMC